MGEVLAVAESVWRRILSMKAVYFLVACAVAEISITVLYKWLMAMHHRKLMVDVSQALITLAGLLCVLALAFDIPRELREGRVAALLTKPLGRPQYLLGKYLGIVFVGLVVTSLIAAGFCLVHAFFFQGLPPAAIKGHVLVVMSVLPMAAVALLYSSLLGEVLAAVLTALTIWFVPVLTFFNMRAETTYNTFDSWPYVIKATVWGIFFSAGLIAFASILFNRRDLT